MKALVAAAASAVLTTACIYEQPVLMPARDAAVYPGRKDVGLLEVEGVRVMVQGDAWRGNPRHLSDIVTPLHVTVENQSGRTLRIRYSDFVLAGESGLSYSAIPMVPSAPGVSARDPMSYQILPAVSELPPGTRTRTVRVVRPRFRHHRFYVAPHFGWVYPGLDIWVHPFPYEPYVYDRYYQTWTEPFPTQDMMDEALPEGALETGGEVSGFLFFQRLGRRETHVELRVTLVDAENGQPAADGTIPLVVWR